MADYQVTHCSFLCFSSSSTACSVEPSVNRPFHVCTRLHNTRTLTPAIRRHVAIICALAMWYKDGGLWSYRRGLCFILVTYHATVVSVKIFMLLLNIYMWNIAIDIWILLSNVKMSFTLLSLFVHLDTLTLLSLLLNIKRNYVCNRTLLKFLHKRNQVITFAFDFYGLKTMDYH